MDDSTLRGRVLKKLQELSTLSPLYLRGDLVQVVCGLQEEDFDRIIGQLIAAKLIDGKFQYSYLFGRDMIAVKITDLGCEVTGRKKEPPISIEIA